VKWRLVRTERSVTYSPAWFEPVDIVTGDRPRTPVRVELDILVGQRWLVTDVGATTTAGGAVAYPGLGRGAEPLVARPRRYRARFEAETYRPVYRAVRDGEEFDVLPFDDTNPPARTAVRTPVEFAPGAGYRFGTGIPVLQGAVVTSAGTPVEDALVTATFLNGVLPRPRTERALSDGRGVFTLPLRWATTGARTRIVAALTRGGANLTGEIDVSVPDDLAHGHTITIR
jgi:hypothetical protein